MPATNIWIMCVIMLVLSPISYYILGEYGIQYRFMRKILKNRWVYYSATYSLLALNGALLILGWCYPSWWLYICGGAWIGTVGQLIPLNYGIRSVAWLSYQTAYDTYVTQAETWEKNLKKKQRKREGKQKRK